MNSEFGASIFLFSASSSYEGLNLYSAMSLSDLDCFFILHVLISLLGALLFSDNGRHQSATDCPHRSRCEYHFSIMQCEHIGHS